MLILPFGRYALSICAAATILTDCGGSAQFPNPTGQTPLGNAAAMQVAPPSLNALGRVSSDRNIELLRALDVRGRCHSGGNLLYEKCRFRTIVPGRATGPYPGTFTARGSFSSEHVGSGRYFFLESFTIKSGAETIKGTIFASGNGFGPPLPSTNTRPQMGTLGA